MCVGNKHKRVQVGPCWCGSVGWRVILYIKRLRVQFLVKAHTIINQ